MALELRVAGPMHLATLTVAAVAGLRAVAIALPAFAKTGFARLQDKAGPADDLP